MCKCSCNDGGSRQDGSQLSTILVNRIFKVSTHFNVFKNMIMKLETINSASIWS